MFVLTNLDLKQKLVQALVEVNLHHFSMDYNFAPHIFETRRHRPVRTLHLKKILGERQTS